MAGPIAGVITQEPHPMSDSVFPYSTLLSTFASLAALAGSAQAQEAGQTLQISAPQVIQGKSFDMPAGDFSDEVRAEAASRLRLVPRRGLNEAQLEQIK